ncbi:MAG: hypothetical protein ABI333_03635 [bacterium]
MAASDQDRVYYCTQCRIETPFATVCPKCHRKGTLQPRGPGDGMPGSPRRRSSAALSSVGPQRVRKWWIAGAGAALALLALLTLGWWLLGRGPSGRPPSETRAGKQVSTAPPRVFGAQPKGIRTPPPPAPRLCGQGYHVSVTYRFTPRPPAPGPRPRPMSSRAAKPGPPRKNTAGQKHPELMEHHHSFLIARGLTGRLSYVPLELKVQITVDGKTGTGLAIGRNGGLLPDPRTRRLRRLGFHDNLQPGLRISDLIGRAQADVTPAARGGLVVARQRHRNRLVTSWVRTGIELATFLHPQPAKDAPVFTDTRIPPQGVLPGLKALVRRFRRQAPAKPAPPAGMVTYRVDSPQGAMRRAKSTTPVTGEVVLHAGEPLPSKAVLTIDGVPERGGTQKVTIRLEHTGKRCSDE